MVGSQSLGGDKPSLAQYGLNHLVYNEGKRISWLSWCSLQLPQVPFTLLLGSVLSLGRVSKVNVDPVLRAKRGELLRVEEGSDRWVMGGC